MRLWLVVVAAVAVLGTAAPAASAAATRIMPLGDSITHGYNVPGGYRIDLEDSLLASGYSFDFVGSQANGPTSLADRQHQGHSGWRIDQIAATIDAYLARYQPEVVLLQIGTNDMLQVYELASAPQRLSALIDQIAAGVPSATILVSSLTPLGTAARDERVRSFNATIPAIVSDKAAQGKRVRFVDMYPALTAADLADGVHPSAAGYGKMARVWHSALTRVLPAPPAGPMTRTMTVEPQADTMVRQASPATASGAATTLKVDAVETTAGSAAHGHLRFSVTGLAPGESVTAARLGVRVTNATADGPAVLRTDPAWDEATLSWNGPVPARLSATPAGNFAAMASGRVETPVTGVTGNGLVSFELAPESGDGLDFASRETSSASYRPQLVLTVSTSPTTEPPPADTTAPAAPTGLAATAGDGSVALKWNASASGDTIRYDVYRTSPGTRTKVSPAGQGTSLTLTDSGLTNGVEHSYVVRAVDAAGNQSPDSAPASATPVGSPTSPPATRTITLFPVADTMVRQASPTTPYPVANPLGADSQELSTSGSAQHSYLRFEVPALAAGETIAEARLSIVVRDPTTNGPALWRTAAGWSEDGLTWNTRGSLASRSATAPSGNFGDLSALGRTATPVSGITEAGPVSFELAPESSGGLDFASREDGTGTVNDPSLTLVVRTG